MLDHHLFCIGPGEVEEIRRRCSDPAFLADYEAWARDCAPLVDGVIQQLTDAFAEVELGDGTGLWEAQGLDDYKVGEELSELRARDEKLDWRKIPVEHLERCNVAPAFMNAHGFVFHLPAFLIAELKDQHGFGFIDRVCRAEESPPGWSELLTFPQSQALIAALRLAGQHPEYERDRSAIELKIGQLARKKRKG